jgi:hypothetical protein
VPDLNRFPHPMDSAAPAGNAGPERNVGHGHVFPRPDGRRSRCGGPALCRECAADLGKRETARAALLEVVGDALLGSPRPTFDQRLAQIAAHRQGEPFPSADGRLWDRVVFGEAGALCAWDGSGAFHLWGPAEQVAEAVLRARG